MTPQEKAKQLVQKFEQILDHNDRYWKSEAHDCALIAVDEILNVCEKEIAHCSDKTYFYWQEVKQKIEKL